MDLQYYLGGIRSNHPRGTVDLETFITKHSSPSDKIVALIDRIALASSKGDLLLKTALKETLPFITPAVIVSKYRRYENIVKFTGITQIDFDGVEDAVALRKYLFDTYKEFKAVYVSPSGKGVKGLLQIPISKDVEEYQDYYRAIEEEFEGIYGFDPAPKNAVLPLFFSYDYFLEYRPDAETWTKKKMKPKSFHQQYPLPPRPVDFTKRGDRNRNRAINTVKKMINGINDNGHPQLRSACLILGTRIGAGYLDIQTAEQEVEYLINVNSYLAKGVKGYITTAGWAIAEGMTTPKYY